MRVLVQGVRPHRNLRALPSHSAMVRGMRRWRLQDIGSASILPAPMQMGGIGEAAVVAEVVAATRTFRPKHDLERGCEP